MALIVESGIGLPDAESYVSVAEADAYFAAYPNDAWDGDINEKEIAIRRATSDLDLVFGSELAGRPAYLAGQPAYLAQALAFPRNDEIVISTRVKRATCELAALVMSGYSATSLSDDAGITEFQYKVEGVYSEVVKYATGKANQPELNRIRLLLAPYLIQPAGENGWSVLNVVRG
jgi:hypothetical protein